MKLTLKQKERLSTGIALVGFALALIGQIKWIRYTGLAMTILGVVIMLMWVRCPNCGKDVYSYKEKNCRYCGKEIDWNAK